MRKLLDTLRRGFWRTMSLLLRIARHRLVAYTMVAFIISFAFTVDQRNYAENAHRQIEKHQYEECMAANKSIKAGNLRLKIITEAQSLLEFKDEAAHKKFNDKLGQATPVALAKCHKPSS